ncbi:hypothetical protein GH733_008830 [Mirounga leonina]|nr:hypothetical protein GH733_008830 [Mirounga leonina]
MCVKEIRKVVQSLEQTAREILTLLQGVHQGAGFQDIPKRCLKAREHFGTVKTHLTSLKTKFPAEQYYRFSRLSVNSVTAGDYSRPLHISTFINELDSGFRLLNLKNDSLRKRYDGLKYDVKKVEEVVYDLSIRGFNKETAAACAEK